MDDAELVGGALVDAADPRAAARQLALLIGGHSTDRAAALKAEIHPDLVDVLRARLGRDRDRVGAACQEGAAWVLGRRSVAAQEPWDIVASLPTGTTLPHGLKRTTGESLIQLVTQAKMAIRLATPFIDRPGLSFLGDALAAATARGVALEVLMPTRWTHADDALADLNMTIRLSGVPGNFQVSHLQLDAPWAHLKVLTSDASAAYIGSANLTGAGMAGRNLELGVLVRGAAVSVVDRVLDLFRIS